MGDLKWGCRQTIAERQSYLFNITPALAIGNNACALAGKAYTAANTQTKTTIDVENGLMANRLRNFSHTDLARLFYDSRDTNLTVIAGIRQHFSAHSNATRRGVNERIDSELAAF